ncbi:MAG: hypothetical protein IJ668_03470 [Selenomonadaceae bacterium]|nr:hypothetical protein [Selenomonadaceae bacterium]
MVQLMDTEEEIDMDTNLLNLPEWDSLSLVGFLAMCRANDRYVEPRNVKAAQTVRDLYVMFTGVK